MMVSLGQIPACWISTYDIIHVLVLPWFIPHPTCIWSNVTCDSIAFYIDFFFEDLSRTFIKDLANIQAFFEPESVLIPNPGDVALQWRNTSNFGPGRDGPCFDGSCHFGGWVEGRYPMIPVCFIFNTLITYYISYSVVYPKIQYIKAGFQMETLFRTSRSSFSFLRRIQRDSRHFWRGHNNRVDLCFFFCSIDFPILLSNLTPPGSHNGSVRMWPREFPVPHSRP